MADFTKTGRLMMAVAVALGLVAGNQAAAHEWRDYDWHWNPSTGHYYALTLGGPVNWAQAENEAIAIGGHLVTINDQDEQDWLVAVFPYEEPYHPWIGLWQDVSAPDYSEPGGGWKWIGGENSAYRNWAVAFGEPNEAAPADTNEDRAQMNAFGPGLWQDIPGDADYAYQRGIMEVPEEIVFVGIDIKPGSYPNSINLGSNGVVPVAILSSADLDATSVDPSTVTLAGAGVAVRGRGDRYMASEEDVDGDGLLDLVIHVETENLDPNAFQDGYAILSGAMYGGTPFEGFDEITIVPN